MSQPPPSPQPTGTPAGLRGRLISGTGALGITMVGGLLVSQVLTLFTTPVIYLAFDRVARRLKKRFGQHDADPDEAGGGTSMPKPVRP